MKGIGKLILISLGMVCLAGTSWGQVGDALLFSRTNPGGTARLQGLGGAQTALGGDVGSALSNPAGLGMFNRGVFTFSPALGFANTSTTNQFDRSETTDDSRLKFMIPHIGVTIYKPQNQFSSQAFKGGSFAFSFTRINDFNDQYTYQLGNSRDDLFSFIFQEMDNGGDFYSNLAFDAFVLDNFFEVNSPGDTTFFRDYIDLPNGEAELPGTITETVETNGAQNQWSISYGANFADKFYIGAGIGITSIRFEETKTYTETRSPSSALRVLTLEEFREVNGTGINATFGMIYRPINLLQLGFSVVTPTRYNLSEDAGSTIIAEFENFVYDNQQLGVETAESDLSNADFNLTTPFRMNFGTTFFVGKRGFITGDVELVDYGRNDISSDDLRNDVEQSINEDINSLYGRSLNFRVGGEFRYNMLRFRAGYALMGDPYDSDLEDGKIQRFSIGAGLRHKKKFFDLAFTRTVLPDFTYQPFGPDIAMAVDVENTRTRVQFTMGFNF